ncbi:hypothetical protein IF2G_02771 [Cordyceps javanica]|nr:hypothetical protein IF2G_02771 [Cordyceps javanica]
MKGKMHPDMVLRCWPFLPPQSQLIREEWPKPDTYQQYGRSTITACRCSGDV